MLLRMCMNSCKNMVWHKYVLSKIPGMQIMYYMALIINTYNAY